MTEERTPRTEAKTATGGDIDRVQMASRLPDGTAHQTPGYEFVGDPDVIEEAARTQLTQQAVSAADTRVRAQQAAAEADDGKVDANTQALRDAQDKAVKAAEARVAGDLKGHLPS